MKRYPINIFYSDEDGGYIAYVPDLRHCSAFGDTPDAALAEVLKAKKAWLKAARTAKKPIPKPTTACAINRAAHVGKGLRRRADGKRATAASSSSALQPSVLQQSRSW